MVLFSWIMSTYMEDIATWRYVQNVATVTDYSSKTIVILTHVTCNK